MRVKISTNPPLPPLRAWFPLALPSVAGCVSTPTVSSFKSSLCASLDAFRGVSSSSLRLSIDGFELLDGSELTIVRDGDLISIDTLDVLPEDGAVSFGFGRVTHKGASRAAQTRPEPATSRKRKRGASPSSSSSESDTESTTSTSASESESESEPESVTSGSESTSDSDESSRPTTPSLPKVGPRKIQARERHQGASSVRPKLALVHPSTFVPPGHGKPQTRSRNLRRRLKRMHGREVASASEDGPVSGANATVRSEKANTQAVADGSQEVHAIPALMSLSLRNKNKAKNFRSLIGKPLPPMIIFGENSASNSGVMTASESVTPAVYSPKSQTASTQAVPRLIPPSSRSSLPPNLFVTSIDVEAGLHRDKKKRKMRVEYGHEVEGVTEMISSNSDAMLDYGEGVEGDVDKLESIANKDWATLEKPTSEKQVKPGMVVGYKALGINPVTYTPEQLLTVGRVLSCDGDSVVVRPLRVRERVSFSGPVDDGHAEDAEEHTWEDILHGDWRVVPE